MTAPALSGALEGLKVFEVSDLARFKHAVNNGEQLGFAYYFPALMSRNRGERAVVLMGEDEGSICIYLWRSGDPDPRLDLLVAPTPMNVAVLERCLQRANEFNGDLSAKVMRLDARDAEALSGKSGLRLRERKTQYLYAPRSFSDLGGRKFRTLRRNVVRVESLPHLEVLPYTSDHEGAARDLLARWGRRHRNVHGTVGGVRTTIGIIELATVLPESELHGEIVLLDGKLVAFAFGGELRPGYGCFFEAKSDIDVPGLSYFHRYSFMSKLERFELVNDGSDAGRAGLRQLKESLRPHSLHAEFAATQRRQPTRVAAVAPRSASDRNVVGLLCNCALGADPIEQLSASLVNRAFLIGDQLAESSIDVFLFSPKDVSTEDVVSGYRVEGRELVRDKRAIPRVNANWTYGTRQLINQGMGYRRFKSWLRENQIGVYVPYEFSELVSNKLKAYQVVNEFGASLHPRTENFDGSEQQIKSFLDSSDVVFVKPRAGNKGNQIFVFRRVGDNVSMKYYDRGHQHFFASITLEVALGIVSIVAGDLNYVVQRGIESIRYEGAVFDIRVVVVNDGTQWHSILETRLAPLNSDVSNVSQGGAIRVSEDMLDSIFGDEVGRATEHKLRHVSRGIAEHLDELFPGEIIEIGLDFVLDSDRGVHLLEVNAKPGVSGLGSETKIFDWEEEDAPYYDKWVRPQMRHLAGFLGSKVAQI